MYGDDTRPITLYTIPCKSNDYLLFRAATPMVLAISALGRFCNTTIKYRTTNMDI
ncbi:hypothetical protein BS47DRAFT_1343622, partial [Hydnum rufescens UP504]